MARTRKPTATKAMIIKSASELFFEKGFSRTTATELCKKANVSTGNLTFYFPTKEYILANLVKMICDFQWKAMEAVTDEGNSSLLAYCLELTIMAAVCEDIPEMQDFITASYAHPLSLEVIRANDVEKIKRVFETYTADWSEERFIATEALISGIEYGALAPTANSAPMEHRVEVALNTVMMIFGVPEDVRRMKISKVLAMDYHAIGRKVYADFRQYVTETNDLTLEKFNEN